MDVTFFRFLLFLVLSRFLRGELIKGEPACMSRFDYEYKVLSKLVELETLQKRLQETVITQQTCINELKQQLETKGL